ncbi:exosome complex component RRP43 [Ciona intestinalis]
MEDIFKHIQPVEYYKSFLKENIRPDTRTLQQIRKTTLNVGPITTADGSALVKIGDTMVMCGVKAELTQPTAEEPKKGIIVPNLDLPALCSSKFKPGPPNTQAQVGTKFLDNLMKIANLVNPEDLCIVPDKLVWVLYCDVTCLNYDGCVIDAAVIALVAALRSVSLPSVTLNEETDTPVTNVNEKTPLTINCLPVAYSFSFFESDHIITDPTLSEEDITSGCLTIVSDEHENLLLVDRPGGVSITEAQLEICIQRSFKRTKEVHKLYKAVHKQSGSNDQT